MSANADTPELSAAMAAKSYGAGLRGNYTTADSNYVITQDWDAYTPQQHALWRKLHQRQAQLMPGHACEEFTEGMARLDVAEGIPRLEQASEILFNATGWSLVTVPGLIPEVAFFDHLAHRRFPITNWLREPHELDFCLEPDIFHDFAGHVPMLLNPVFADQMQLYGKAGLKTTNPDDLPYLSRLYLYTMEFGLVRTAVGLRAFGAALLSSPGEMAHSLGKTSTPNAPQHVAFDVERVMRTVYKIHAYQETYFVINSFEQLFDEFEVKCLQLYSRLKQQPPILPNSLLAWEVNLKTG